MRFTKFIFPAAALVFAVETTSNANAFEVSVPSVTTANPGGYANPLKLDTERYRLEQRKKAQPRQQQRNKVQSRKSVQVTCSADSVPEAERRQLLAEGARIERRHGRAAAVAWANRKGQEYHRRLQRQGICP